MEFSFLLLKKERNREARLNPFLILNNNINKL